MALHSIFLGGSDSLGMETADFKLGNDLGKA